MAFSRRYSYRSNNDKYNLLTISFVLSASEIKLELLTVYFDVFSNG